jgi:N utilization substance protein B
MGVRRRGRELALQALYRVEITGDESGQAVEELWHHFEAPGEARNFAADLVRGVIGERARIDELLAGAAEHWSLERLSRVDHTVLRVATLELLRHDPLVPTSVVIDEAIEIARRFGGEQSAQFVNGILDAVAGALGTREKGPAAEERKV